MQISGIPDKMSVAFGEDAGSDYIRDIPTDSQIGVTDGRASLTDGFPPLTMTLESAGGVPMAGRDMNGILNWITEWNRWQAAGAPSIYDSTFQTAISGYPLNSIIRSASTAGQYYISTTDANTTNPDSSGAGWTAFSPIPATTTEVVTGTDTTHAITPYTLNYSITRYVPKVSYSVHSTATYTCSSTWITKTVTLPYATAVKVTFTGNCTATEATAYCQLYIDGTAVPGAYSQSGSSSGSSDDVLTNTMVICAVKEGLSASSHVFAVRYTHTGDGSLTINGGGSIIIETVTVL